VIEQPLQFCYRHRSIVRVLLTLRVIDSYYDELGWGQKPPS
jgi:hypothetical protein